MAATRAHAAPCQGKLISYLPQAISKQECLYSLVA